MSLEIRKKGNEAVGHFFFQFKKKIQQSGIAREARKRRFFERPENRRKRRYSALYRAKKQEKRLNDKKYGV
jgi:ribosomal protein S21